jgi:hypothetical protein
MRARSIILISAISALIGLSGSASAGIKATYLYNLSNFTGAVRASSARVSVDNVHKEAYLITGELIRVFNANGMEIYSFGEDLNVGVFYDAAVDPNGNIYVLSHSYERNGMIVTLCNYRGEPIREITFTNLPPEFKGFEPNRMVLRNGNLYFVSESEMRVVVTDANGVFKEGVDLFSLMDVKPEKEDIRYRFEKDAKPREPEREDYGIAGFYVDQERYLLFTSPNTAKAYVVTPDKKVESFGKRGQRPAGSLFPRDGERQVGQHSRLRHTQERGSDLQ